MRSGRVPCPSRREDGGFAPLMSKFFERSDDIVAAPHERVDSAALDQITNLLRDLGLVERLDALEERSIDLVERFPDFERLRPLVREAARAVNLDKVPLRIEQQVGLVLVDVGHEVVE